MQRIGATLWPTLQTFQVYGANTDVGKTIVSTILCKAFREKRRARVHYLKPVSTGANDQADSRHISKFIDGINTETIFQFSKPVSPHLAARADGRVPSDFEIIEKTYDSLLQSAKRGEHVSIVETAGGVLSPAPSGNAQADLYRPLRLPVLFVGDYHLGGIGTSISAYESLRVRGYDVLLHVIFEEDLYQNVKYLTDHFSDQGIPTLALPKPPKMLKNEDADLEAMWSYYSEVASLDVIYRQLDNLSSKHQERIDNLKSMPERAHKSIWYPFTQHKGRTRKDIMVIDSAYKNNFDALVPGVNEPDQSHLRAAVDASASWWTQGLGHGNPQLSLAAAYAAGRYGHVMFASAIHEPALKIAESLLENHQNPNLAKVFFSDNGSTGMEVAIKMALRASRDRYGWNHKDENIEILGLKGSYHGDTMGVMDTAEPGTYNEKVEWYNPKGFWFDYPKVKMNNGKWIIEIPEDLRDQLGEDITLSSNLNEIFDEKRIGSSQYQKYQDYIKATLESLRDQGRKFGALIMEPVILGAGGMIFADPLFQKALIEVVRQQPTVISKSNSKPIRSASSNGLSNPWAGLPVVFDEVFTGVYRLGRFNCNSFVHARPDIVVNAKLLTGGLLPLCTTTASQEIFDAFLSDSKTDALLHGHSYTAHAVGSHVAVESVKIMKKMEEDKEWLTELAESWKETSVKDDRELAWSTWNKNDVIEISKLDKVDGVVALGTVLAVSLKDEAGAGYTSLATQDLHKKLLDIGERGWSIHSRVLGNVIYFMSSLTVTSRTVEAVAKRILEELK